MFVAWQTCATRFTCFARIGTGGTRPIKWTGSRGSWRAYGGRSRGQHSQRAHTKARPTEGKGLRSARIKTRGAGPSKMNQMSRGFKKWCLPSKHVNGMPDPSDFDSDLGNTIKLFFEKLEEYNRDPTEDTYNMVVYVSEKIQKFRTEVFVQCCETILDELGAKEMSESAHRDSLPENLFEQQLHRQGTERHPKLMIRRTDVSLLQADAIDEGENQEEHQVDDGADNQDEEEQPENDEDHDEEDYEDEDDEEDYEDEDDEEDYEDEYDDEDNSVQYKKPPEKWDGYQAMTMVSHMIYSQKRDEPKRKLNHSPILYRLEDPRTGRGENLVQVYRGVDTHTRDYRQPMRMIWDNIREFLELDSGEFIAETLRTQDGSAISEAGLYAQEQMLKLRYVMSNATEMSHSSGNHLGMDYKGDMLNKMELSYDNGKVAMMVCDGIPDVANLNMFLVTEKIASIVNATIQRWKDSSPGLFVSIIWTSHDGETSEHYLYLSEYQRVKLHATMAKGFIDEWMQRDHDSGKPLFEEQQVAIDKRLTVKQTPHNVWHIPEPCKCKDMMLDIIRYMTKNFSAERWDTILRNLEDRDDADKVNEFELIRPSFFSGDNMAFIVIVFDTDHELIREMLDIGDDSRGLYAHVLVVRYPVLNLNIDQVMINIRRKYFMRYSPNPNKWDEWLHEEWHIPGERRWDDPQKYQVHPDFNDPMQTKVERDSKGNIVYPLRLLAVLPPGASWQVLHSRHRSMSTSFFVNNVDPDPFVVHRRSVESTAEWDDIQLFRINTETKISRVGYERHNQTFFNFRTEGLNARARGHPFKAYLEKYPDLQPEWRALWLEKYPNMYGWTQLGELGERNTRNRRGGNRDQPQQRQQTRRQGRHHAQGQRQQPRSQGHRQQPMSQGHRQQPRPQGQGQAQGRRARRRQRASNNAPRNAPRNGARLTQKLRWPTNPKRVLSERRQNEKYLVHLMYDCLKAQ